MSLYSYTLQFHDKITAGLGKVSKFSAQAETSLGKLTEKAMKANQTLELMDRAVSAVNEPLNKAAAISDKMAIVQKNTGSTKEEMDALKESIDGINTRTATASLLDMASVGGKLGIPKQELQGFVKVVDMANVALGDEFGNNAALVAEHLAKVKNQFKEFSGQGYEASLMKIGSAINFVGKQGANSAPNLTEFAKRFSTAGLTLSQTLGIGATLEELGMDAERGASGVKSVLDLMGKESQQFAKFMGMSQKEFEGLVDTNKYEALLKFSEKFAGASSTQIAKTFKELKIGNQESSDAILKLSENLPLLQRRQIEANFAMQKANDLHGEFGLMNNTLAARMDKMKKKIDEASVGIGMFLSPFAPLIQMTGMLAITLSSLLPILGSVASLLLTSAWNALKFGANLVWTAVKGVALFTANLVRSAAVGLWSFALQLTRTNFSLGMFIARIQLQASLALALFMNRLRNFSFISFIRGLAMAGLAAVQAAGRWIFAGLTGLGTFVTSMGAAIVSQIALNAAMYANPIGVVIAAILALAGAVWLIIENWDVIKQWLVDLGNFMVALNPFKILLDSIDSLFPGFLSTLEQWWQTLVGWFKDAWQEVKKIWDWFAEATGLSSSAEIAMNADAGLEELQSQLKALGLDKVVAPDKDATFTSPFDTKTPTSRRASGGLESVSGGGSRPVNINIQIGSLIEGGFTVQTTNINEAEDRIEQTVLNVLLRAVNSANQMAGI